MSFEQDIVNLSDMALIMRKSGEGCTDSQFENGENLAQHKGLSSVTKLLIMEIKAVRNKDTISKQKDRIRELEQRPQSSTVLPEE